MKSICPIDELCATQVAALLQPPPPHLVEEYFEHLLTTKKCHAIKVKQNGEFGKGVYANMDFREEELILKDEILLGHQHHSNKLDCLVCSYCFRFIGSIELQLGRKLYLQNLGVSMDNEGDVATSAHTSEDCCNTVSSDEENDISYVNNHEIMGDCVSFSSKTEVPLPQGVVESLLNGELKLPYSNKLPLPSAISCPGECGEGYYCSKLCADFDWESSHSLLCTGKTSESLSREALSKFIQHANETNDIFLLAAKAISFTTLRYRKLKSTRLKEQEKHTTSDELDQSNLSLLLEAWKPMSVAYKRRWWDCIALPDDIDCSDEVAFRMQIKELAFTSLQLLKEAIFDKECEPLFSLEIYGHIIGIFELNNLDLVVESPMEDYFSYIDGLPHPEKIQAGKIARPFLEALGDDYSVCCQGTAFYPLQSCINHSCCPNAKAFKREEDRDGQATIISARPICKGEEVTISYIDENLPFEVRQALLADYGFECRCSKCLEEEP
ncbi:SET domain-containing protein [Cephalotus follicularis]|uniref:SET domain-containing protein n=1 Tax=Cephalotus follicularis TaxID=3775 RepID=A0A1Q3CMF8_CEPFO|nr:SET domain-containing protein [Cephalotus follicularis]